MVERDSSILHGCRYGLSQLNWLSVATLGFKSQMKTVKLVIIIVV
jgi:hypothetical protein